MKTKRRKRNLSEGRILQISNDISENMCSAHSEELVEVVKYFRDELDRQIRENVAFRDKIVRATMEHIIT